jgi:TfoX/Sxy family transcriptional regulator of competence genes
VGVSAATRAWVLELFEDLGGVSARAMMGGLTLYRAGRIFAIVGGDDRIYLKASGPLAEQAAGRISEPRQALGRAAVNPDKERFPHHFPVDCRAWIV